MIPAALGPGAGEEFHHAEPADTVMREIGLMTLLARKAHGAWRWTAVTTQHAPDFDERIDRVFMN